LEKQDNTEQVLQRADDIDKMVEEAPLMNAPGEKPAEKTDEISETEPGKEPEGKKSGGVDEKDESEKEDVKEPLKIGDIEATPEEVLAWKKEFENKANWEKILRQKSQIVNNLDEEAIQHLLPYANKQKDLPNQFETIVDEMLPDILKDEDILEVEGVDEDGLETTVNVPAAILKDNLKQAALKVLEKVNPVFEKTAAELQKAQDTIAEYEITNFMNGHKDLTMNVPAGMTLREYIGEIEKAGSEHPDYVNAQKLVVLSDVMGKNKLQSLDEAYNFLYGDKDSKVESAEEKAKRIEDTQKKIVEKQEKITSEKPGQAVKVDDDEKFWSDINDSRERKIESLFK